MECMVLLSHWGAHMGKRFLFNFYTVLCLPCSLNFFSVLFLACDLLASLTCLPNPPRAVVCFWIPQFLELCHWSHLVCLLFSPFVGHSFLLEPYKFMVLFLLLMFSGTAVNSVPGIKLVNSPMFYFQAYLLPSGCFSAFVSHCAKWLNINMNKQVDDLSELSTVNLI